MINRVENIRKFRWIMLLCMIALICLLFVVSSDSITALESMKKLTFRLNSNGDNYSVVDCEENANIIIIPPFYGGLPVTNIGGDAFSGCTSLIEVDIPDTVRCIEDSAFNDCPLNLTTYGNARYLGGKSNPYLMFFDVTSTNISKIKIHRDCRFISGGAFEDCVNLTSIDIPDTVIDIAPTAFKNCPNLELNSYDNAYYLGSEKNPYLCLYKAKNTNIESCDIPDSCKVIYDMAFMNCESLTEITLPNDLNRIGMSTFSMCINLETINHGNNISAISGSAFFKCSALKEPIFAKDSSMLFNGMFYECDAIKEVVIPEGVRKMESGSFIRCASLEKVVLPSTLLEMGMAFQGCENLKEVVFAEGCQLKEIKAGMFGRCTSLKSIELPQSLEIIGDEAFFGCTALTEMVLPSSLKSIGHNAFYGCVGLRNMIIPENVEIADSDIFGVENSMNEIGGILYRADGDNLFYEMIAVLDGYNDKTTIEINENCKIVNLEGCYNLTYVDIPNGVESICFTGCESLEEIHIPDNVNKLASCCFMNCSKLENIIIPNSITEIPDHAFQSCTSLESIILPDTIKTIGTWAFSECSVLSNIVIPNGVERIELYAFYKCYGITNLDIPNSVVEIDEGAFRECKNLESVIISDSVNRIGNSAFCDCEKLSHVELSAGLTSIEGATFSGCVNLNGTVIIPDSVTYIDSFAFGGCYQTSVILNDSYNLREGAFFDVTIYYKKTNDGYDYNLSKLYFYSETQPIDDGLYWHYVEGVPTSW